MFIELKIHVKEKIKENPLVPTQQLYENQRAEERTQSETPLPDYFDVKCRFTRLRSKNSKTNASSLSSFIVNDTKTKDNYNLLIIKSESEPITDNYFHYFH